MMKITIAPILAAILMTFGGQASAQLTPPAPPAIPSQIEIDSLIRHSIQIRLDTDETELSGILKLPPEVWAKLDSQQVQEILREAMEVRAQPPAFPEPHFTDVLEDVLVPIVAILMAFGTPVLIVLLVLRYRRNANKQRHQERMAMIEKGIYDPALADEPTAKERVPSAQRMAVWGMILGFSGVGLSLMNILEDGIREAGLGIVIAMIGAALFAAARYVAQTKREADAAADTRNELDT